MPLPGGGVGAAVPAEGLQDVADLQDHVLALTENNGIDEVGERLGVEDDRTTGDDQRIGLLALRRRERHSAEVEHFQNVGRHEFESEAESEDVELSQGAPGFEAPEGQLGSP